MKFVIERLSGREGAVRWRLELSEGGCRRVGPGRLLVLNCFGCF